MKTKYAIIFLGLFISQLLFIACVQNEALPNSSSEITVSKIPISVSESSLLALIEITSFDSTKTWKDLDKIYREQIVPTNSRDLKNNAYIYMVRTKNLIEEADIPTLQFYAEELEKIEFNINLNTIVMLINKLSSVWGKVETARYSRTMYEKNTRYWNDNFTGKTSYLIKNEVALKDFKSLYVTN